MQLPTSNILKNMSLMRKLQRRNLQVFGIARLWSQNNDDDTLSLKQKKPKNKTYL